MPHSAIRPKAFMRASVASRIMPPTFSKQPSTPSGVASFSAWYSAFGSAVRLVVDAGVEAEFLGDVGALLGAAGDADRAAAARLGELADDAADRAAGGADDDRLPRLRLADLRCRPYHAVTPGMPTGAELGRERDARGVDLAQRARRAAHRRRAYSCQPPKPTTLSPGISRDGATLDDPPTVPPCITLSSGCGWA